MKIRVGRRLLRVTNLSCCASPRLPKFVRRLLRFLLRRISRSRSLAEIRTYFRTQKNRTRPSSFPTDRDVSKRKNNAAVKGFDRRRKLVPEGLLAVSVGEDWQRFVIPIVYLYHPFFTKLLKESEKEFGYRRDGPLAIPCDVDDFEQLKWLIDRECMPSSEGQHFRHVGFSGDGLADVSVRSR